MTIGSEVQIMNHPEFEHISGRGKSSFLLLIAQDHSVMSATVCITLHS